MWRRGPSPRMRCRSSAITPTSWHAARLALRCSRPPRCRKLTTLDDDDLRAIVSEERIAAHRSRALTPDHPVLRGTAQNPDTFFQAREASNLFYLACPDIVEQLMTRF